jgi:Family of unknown function (DUF5723)
MHILRKLVFSSLFIQITIILSGQEQLGLRLDNYAGVSGIFSNPASMAAAGQIGWDINLVGFHASLANDIAFLGKTNLLDAYKNIDKISVNPAIGFSFANRKNPNIYFDFYDNVKSKQLSGSLNILGPSAILNMAKGHTFGFFTAFRAIGSSFDLPYVANAYEFMRQDRSKNVKVDPFQAAFLSWGEFGLHYSFRIGDPYDKAGLTFGANLKYLQGYQSGFVRNYSGASYQILALDSIRISSTKTVFGFTNNALTNPTQVNGGGWGIDVGAMLTLDYGSEDKPYDWRIGASFLDLGQVRMAKNVEVHNFLVKESLDVTAKDFENINWSDPFSEGVRVLNNKVYGKPDESLTKNNYYIMLPAALQVQADYAVTKEFFINAMILKRLTPFDLMVERNDILAITPRYESRWLGLSMPISIVNFKQPRVGLAGRVAFVTMGTDYLGSFIGKNNVTGTDFYMAVKVNPFQIGKWSKKEIKRNPKPRCFKF